MKVLIATDVTVAGGVDVYVRALAEALAVERHEPELVAAAQPHRPADRRADLVRRR